MGVTAEGKTTVLRKGRMGISAGMTFMASSWSLKRLSQGNMDHISLIGILYATFFSCAAL